MSEALEGDRYMRCDGTLMVILSYPYLPVAVSLGGT